ncbi:MAG: hypothetical protein ACOCQ4_01360 [bacterium]
MNKKPVFGLFVFLMLFTSVGFASFQVTLQENGNRIVPNNTQNLILTVENNNTAGSGEITKIGLNLSDEFVITNSKDDDTEGDWTLNGTNLTDNYIIPNETVTFNLSVANLTEGIHNIQFILNDSINYYQNISVIGPGDLGLDIYKPDENPASVTSAKILGANGTTLNTTFDHFPDNVKTGDNWTNNVDNTDGLVKFDNNSLITVNASNGAYLNLSTSNSRLKRNISYSPSSYNQVKINLFDVKTYHDSEFTDENYTFSNNSNAYNTVHVNASTGLNVNKLYQNENLTSNGNENNVTVKKNMSDTIRLDSSYGTNTIMTDLTIDGTAPGEVSINNWTSPENTETVFLNWSSVNSEEKYKIYRNNSLLVETTATNYTDYNVTKNLTYNYNISAVDVAGNEGPTDNVTVQVHNSNDTTPPNNVTSITATPRPVGDVYINWTAPKGEPVDHYMIFEDSSNKKTTTNTYKNLPSATVDGNTHTYSVVPVDEAGNNISVSEAQQIANDTAMADNVTPEHGGIANITLSNDLDSDGVAEIGDEIEINITDIHDRHSSSEGTFKGVSSVSINLTALGGPSQFNLTNSSGDNKNWTAKYNISSGQVNNSDEPITITAKDAAGNTKDITVTASPHIYNYKTKITEVEIRDTKDNRMNGENLNESERYNVYPRYENTNYRGDVSILVKVTNSSNIVEFDWCLLPAIDTDWDKTCAVGFKPESSGTYDINVYMLSDWLVEDGHTIADSYTITKTVE